jgi:uncharacterized protein YecE (DUF72 family)
LTPAPAKKRASKYIAAAAEHLAPAPHNLFVGTSGWAYPTWKPDFYPKNVPSKAFLHHFSSVLTAVEVNYTFRTLPTRTQLEGWLAATPPGFRFSFKAPQRITHFSRLRDCAAEIDRLLAALEPAREAGKLGPILFQLPPNFQADPARLQAFLQSPTLRAQPAPAIAFEFRHPSWFAPTIYEILRAHNAALCIADTDDLSTPDIATANFRCYRLRRDGGYTPAELNTFAQRFTALAKDSETYVFFRHQEQPTGALNATALLRVAVELAANAPEAA